MSMHTRTCGAVVAASLLMFVTAADAALIELSGSGDVSVNNQFERAMLGSTFTFGIVIDTDSPVTWSGGSAIAGFDGAVQSFTVDSFSIPMTGGGGVTCIRQSDCDIIDADAGGLDPLYFDFAGILPLGYLGSGPYDLDLLMDIESSDFTSAAVTLMDDSTDGYATGDITSLSAEIVPEPASLSLLAIGGLALRRRR